MKSRASTKKAKLRLQAEDIAFLSISDLMKHYRAKALSPVEVTEIVCARIKAWNPRINAFCVVDEAAAMAAARASKRRWQKSAPVGALDGVPISVKDTLQIKGYPTRKGSKLTSEAPAGENAPVVDRVLEQGAVIVGTTTTPEFAVGPVTISPLTGVTRNPWDLSKGSGGSSGGAAAATAAGLGYAALGTDAGGSIRIPASLCGVIGLKPTGGRVPIHPPSIAGSLATTGPITRYVRDAALMHTITTQPDVRDIEGLSPDFCDYSADIDKGVKDLRIAYSATLGYAPKVDPEVARIVADAVKTFVKLGARVEKADPGIEDPHDMFVALFHAGAAFSLREMAQEKLKLLGPIMRDAFAAGQKITLREYFEIQEARRALALKMARFHERFDLLVTPMLAAVAFDAERIKPASFDEFDHMRSWTPFGYPFNLTLQPAISVPCGFTACGLPVGLQIVGPRFADALVLRAARLFEKSFLMKRRRP